MSAQIGGGDDSTTTTGFISLNSTSSGSLVISDPTVNGITNITIGGGTGVMFSDTGSTIDLHVGNWREPTEWQQLWLFSKRMLPNRDLFDEYEEWREKA